MNQLHSTPSTHGSPPGRQAPGPVRRFRPSPWPRLIALAVLVLVALRFWTAAPPESLPPPPLDTGNFHVEYVYDGDTLLLTTGQRVRLIGVDTPETVKRNHPVEPFGPEATAFSRAWLSGGEVRLEFDQERLDRYGRTLAYVWIGDRMLNEELLRRPGPVRAAVSLFRSDEAPLPRRPGRSASGGRGIWSRSEQKSGID